MTEPQLFAFLGKQLFPDPEVALKPVRLPPFTPDVGPYHKVQYVIELVGPHYVPANEAKSLLESRHKAALGHPEIYVMAPTDRRWKSLWQGDDSISYDSIVLTWDFVTTRGSLTGRNAAALLERAEQVASAIGRKAMPLPPPEDVDARSAALTQIQESLDISVDLEVHADRFDLATAEAIQALYDLGFRLRDSGLPEWRQQGWPDALITAYTLDDKERFDPKSHPTVTGVALGFSVPCSPSPEEVFDRLYAAATHLAGALSASVWDDEGDPVTESKWAGYKSNLLAALDAFERIGLEPGSPEALRLFEP